LATSAILGLIVVGAVIVEFLGLLRYGSWWVEPAMLPVLVLPPLALIAFIVFQVSQRLRSERSEGEADIEDLDLVNDEEREDRIEDSRGN
jgi:hypothetical protein